MSRTILVLGEIVFVAVLCVVAFFMFRERSPIDGAVRADIRLSDSRAQVYLQRDGQGTLHYFVFHPGGSTEKLTADQISDRLFSDAKKGQVASVLGSSSSTLLLWLGIGLMGQLLFTGRMVVQWVASERKGTSIVPPMFWWMSLVGSLLLLSYFMWRRDPIGLLGQAFGSFIYLRNIIWILEGRQISAVATAEAAEPSAS